MYFLHVRCKTADHFHPYSQPNHNIRLSRFAQQRVQQTQSMASGFFCGHSDMNHSNSKAQISELTSPVNDVARISKCSVGVWLNVEKGFEQKPSKKSSLNITVTQLLSA